MRVVLYLTIGAMITAVVIGFVNFVSRDSRNEASYELGKKMGQSEAHSLVETGLTLSQACKNALEWQCTSNKPPEGFNVVD